MTGPRISVIIPCFNLGRYLDETVESVLAQTRQDFEIVIVNDGSTDEETNRLLADYRRPKTRVLTTENRGIAAARNLAIAHSTGEYLCALDADDKLAPTIFERTIPILDENPSIAWVSCWLETFGDESWVWKPERCDFETLLGECTVCTAAPVRRAAALAVGGFDTGMRAMQDWAFWIALAERGFTGIILPEVLFYYRRRAGSISTKSWYGEWHMELISYLVNKHRVSYQAHLFDLLMAKERSAFELLRENYALERRINTWLAPTIERRQEERERLRRRVATLQPLAGWPRRLHGWRQWKILAPLKPLYRRVRRTAGSLRARWA